MAELVKATDLGSVHPMVAWVQIPLGVIKKTQILFFFHNYHNICYGLGFGVLFVS